METATVLQPGWRISHYRVVGPLGAGGMGEVYLAQDLDLERSVALKILPPHLVANEDRLRRFILEAKSASSLNHPNIVTIHEIGSGAILADEPKEASPGHAVPDPVSAASVQFIAMEFVSGKTLAELIHQGTEDLRTLLGYLAQAADGLAKAHASGIVHRDLKPGNIMVSKDGFAKVLDFGLAKLVESGAAREDLTGAATEIQQRTGEGVILGTAGYMSPEQVQGRPVDHRSDIFSFGSILYEAAARRRPFAGDSSVETMHKILTEKPQPLEELNPKAPAELRRLIRRCLAKAPDLRLQSMKDLAIELREIVEEYDALSASATSGGSVAPGPLVARTGTRPALLAAVAALGLAGLAFGVYGFLGRRSPPSTAAVPPATRMTVIPVRGSINGAALSRDGRYLARVSGPPGLMSLWMRQLATGSEIEILPPSDKPAAGLAFSPDGEYLYYLRGDQESSGYSSLYEIPSLGGTPRKRAFDVDSAISFAPDGRKAAFYRGIPATGESTLNVLDLGNGETRRIAAVKRPEVYRAGPVWSPDGRVMAVSIWRPDRALSSRLVVIDAQTGAPTALGSEGWGYVNGLAWRTGGDGLVMTAATKDITSSAQLWGVSYPGGHAVPITNDLDFYWGAMVAGDGRTVAAVRDTQLINLWIAVSDGRSRPKAITFQSSKENSVSNYTPAGSDGVVFAAREDDWQRLYRMGDDGTGRRAITRGPAHAFFPNWLPDGSLIFNQLGEDRRPHVWRLTPGGEDPHKVTDGSGELVTAVSPDGLTTLFTRFEAPRVLWTIPSSGGEARPLLQDFDGNPDRGALFSRDGIRIVYASLREVNGLSRVHTVIASASGGEPRAVLQLPASAFNVAWTPDGEALSYIIDEAGVHNVVRQPIAGGPPVPITRYTEGRIQIHRWSPDGKRLLLIRWLDNEDNLWTLRADGSDPVRLTDFATGHMAEAEWTPDGNRILFGYGDIASDIVLIREANSIMSPRSSSP